MMVLIGGEPHIIDPGFLVLDPVPAGKPARLQTAFNEVVLEPRAGEGKIELFTVQQGARTHRLTFKAAPADSGEFLQAWDASFDWDMMRYPLLTRVSGGSQLYLQKAKFQVRGLRGVERQSVDVAHLPGLVESRFGLRGEIAARALEVLKRKGEMRGMSRRA